VLTTLSELPKTAQTRKIGSPFSNASPREALFSSVHASFPLSYHVSCPCHRFADVHFNSLFFKTRVALRRIGYALPLVIKNMAVFFNARKPDRWQGTKKTHENMKGENK